MTDPAPIVAVETGCPRTDCPVKVLPADAPEVARVRLIKEGIRLSKELLRFELRHREDKIVRLLLHLSYGAGSKSVCIPRQELFGEWIGASTGNISAALEQLHNMRIVRVSRRAGHTNYELNPNVEEWRCRALVSAEKATHAAEVVRAYNDHLAAGASGIPENFAGSSDAPFLPHMMTAGDAPAENPDSL